MITPTQIKEIHELFELLPQKCLDSCNCSGDNYEACEFWVDKLNLNIDRETCIEMLSEVGAWEDIELQYDSERELNIKVLWIAAGYERD